MGDTSEIVVEIVSQRKRCLINRYKILLVKLYAKKTWLLLECHWNICILDT